MPNVSFGHHFDEFVNQLVESGRYNSVSEVVCSALRLLELQENQNVSNHFIAEVQKGLDSGNAGTLDMAEIKRIARERYSSLASR